jgi:hypothetical protein
MPADLESDLDRIAMSHFPYSIVKQKTPYIHFANIVAVISQSSPYQTASQV